VVYGGDGSDYYVRRNIEVEARTLKARLCMLIYIVRVYKIYSRYKDL
jgi:hypothetical protein